MHRMQRVLAITAACGLVLTARTTPAQEPLSGAISGRVTDGHGTPLYGAHIDITDQTSGRAVTALTRQDGEYAVYGLSLGRPYQVLIRSVGFAPLRRTVTMPDTAPPGAPVDPVVDAVLLPIDRASTAMRG